MTTPRIRVPPGRAGRLWLEQRLGIARRGAGLLDRKLRILSGELGRLRDQAAQTGLEWERACGEAERWLLRASLLGGERSVRLGTGSDLAQVRIGYTVTMGARHPSGARCAIPGSPTWDGPALASARRAYGDALAAGAAYAAAAAAVRIVEAETAATRYRLRAVRDRWIPGLERALAEVTFTLEELERADGARLRQALRVRGREWPQAGSGGAAGDGPLR